MTILLNHWVTTRQLLSILPALYDDLTIYPKTLSSTRSPGIPALQPYFLYPHQKQTSLYAVDVAGSLQEFIDHTDGELMELYLKKPCSVLPESLKMQRETRDDFRQDPASESHINMTEDMIDDPDCTNTKLITNLFSNLGKELEKVGIQGFDKVSDDLVMKYGENPDSSQPV